MPPDDDVRLRHLVDAAERAMQFAAGRSRADLDLDVLWSTVRDDLPALVELIPPPESDT